MCTCLFVCMYVCDCVQVLSCVPSLLRSVQLSCITWNSQGNHALAKDLVAPNV